MRNNQREYEHLSFPVECKFIKADDDINGGVIEGHASVFGNVDLGNDVVIKGAFKKTIRDRVKSGMVKFLAGHDMFNPQSLLGTVISAKEDDSGLFFKAVLSKAPSVQDIKTKMEEGHLQSLSFGFDVIKHSFEKIKGQTIRKLEELKLWEISVVGFPMNERAMIDSVKYLSIPFQNLPIAPADTSWDRDGAEVRVKRWAGNSTQKQSMAYINRLDTGELHLPIADVIGKELMVIPAAIDNVLENFSGEDNKSLLDHVNKYKTQFDSEIKPGKPLDDDGNSNPSIAEPDSPLTFEAIRINAKAKIGLLELNEKVNND